MKISDLETERCILKEINADDANQIVEWRSNPEVYKYFKKPMRISVESHLKWFNEHYLYDKNRIDFVVWLKNSSTRIGVFGITRIDDKSAEVSYLLDDNFQGKGYASEVLNRLESYFSKEWNVNTFIAEIHKDNNKSISFVKKMGYLQINVVGDFVIFGKRK